MNVAASCRDNTPPGQGHACEPRCPLRQSHQATRQHATPWQDTNNDQDYDDAGDWTHYCLTDHQFSAVCLIDDTAAIVERVSYDAYGKARHHWPMDIDGDGDVDGADGTAATNANGEAIYDLGYNPDADFGRDGTSGASITSNDHVSALAAGVLSASDVGNPVGYAGYVFSGESFLYHVRFRWYDPQFGRWLERDPAGYVDGMSLYEYVGGFPITGLDPMGLEDWLHDLREFQRGRADAARDAERAFWQVVDGSGAVAEVAIEETAWWLATGPAGAAARHLARAGSAAARGLGRLAILGGRGVRAGGVMVAASAKRFGRTAERKAGMIDGRRERAAQPRRSRRPAPTGGA